MVFGIENLAVGVCGKTGKLITQPMRNGEILREVAEQICLNCPIKPCGKLQIIPTPGQALKPDSHILYQRMDAPIPSSVG